MSTSNHVQITFQHVNADQAWIFWKTVLLPNVFVSKDLPGSAKRIVPVGWTAAYERVGHDHTHVYIGFTSRWTLQNIKWYIAECHNMADGGHIELCRGQPSENVHYLLGGPGVDGKETPREVIPPDFFQRDATPPSWAPNRYFYQIGHVLPDNVNVQRGQRTDLEDVYNDLEQGMEWQVLEKKYPKHVIMYHRSLSTLYSTHLQRRARAKLTSQFLNGHLRDWQNSCLKNLESQTQRQIAWYWDEKGNTGKTWMCQYLVAVKGYLYLESGPRRDLAHALSVAAEDSTVAGICVDLTKSFASSGESSDMIARLSPIMSLLEAAKNGMVYSGKYSSKVTYLEDCKVLVVANFVPSKQERSMLLSDDRWCVHHLSDLSSIFPGTAES